jgi:hypothetical protein
MVPLSAPDRGRLLWISILSRLVVGVVLLPATVRRGERQHAGRPAEPPPVLQDGGGSPTERLADGHGGPALGTTDGGDDGDQRE